MQTVKRLNEFLYLCRYKQHCLGREIDLKFTLFTA